MNFFTEFWKINFGNNVKSTCNNYLNIIDDYSNEIEKLQEISSNYQMLLRIFVGLATVFGGMLLNSAYQRMYTKKVCSNCNLKECKCVNEVDKEDCSSSSSSSCSD